MTNIVDINDDELKELNVTKEEYFLIATFYSTAKFLESKGEKVTKQNIHISDLMKVHQITKKLGAEKLGKLIVHIQTNLKED